MNPPHPVSIAAVDLGATSGRVIVGTLTDGHLGVAEIARFPNEIDHSADGLHWNIAELYRHALDGLALAERRSPGGLASIGIDSWAVDYGLLRDGVLLGPPYHYRDARTAAGVAAVHAKINAAELYRRNGIQHLDFTTVFQLAAEPVERLAQADTLLLIPDLLGFWLTGARVAERTNASTTGLLDPHTGDWDRDLCATLGIPDRLLAPLIDPGTRVGALTGSAREHLGRAVEVVAVASHDTASAVVAIPNTGRDFAYICCGTWGLVGLELDAPVLTDAARAANFTNEAGVDGRVRFLRNVMGLWLLSESLREWHACGESHPGTLEQLIEAAADVPAASVPIIDVADQRFFAPGAMGERIAGWCRQHGQRAPRTPPEIVRTIIESLAQAYVDTVAAAAALAGYQVATIHIVGGGARNALLCQAVADRSGLPVLAGPVEATAIGNLVIQARAIGLLDADLAGLRALVARDVAPVAYQPGGAAPCPAARG